MVGWMPFLTPTLFFYPGFGQTGNAKSLAKFVDIIKYDYNFNFVLLNSMAMENLPYRLQIFGDIIFCLLELQKYLGTYCTNALGLVSMTNILLKSIMSKWLTFYIFHECFRVRLAWKKFLLKFYVTNSKKCCKYSIYFIEK